VSPATVSLLALLTAIIVSCFSRVNVGVVAIALAWGVGIAAGMTAEAVLAGFPSSLFITLAGVTLLFSLAEVNGTIAWFARRMLRLARGRAALLPIVIFTIACLISSVGPGAIASVALTAPIAMAVALRAGISPFLTALVVANGANAGNLSPVSAVGIIANSRIAAAGLGTHAFKVFLANFIAHALVAAVAYLALAPRRTDTRIAADAQDAVPITRQQTFSVLVLTAWIAGVILLRLPIGLSAFAAAGLLIVARAAEESTAVTRMPWGALVMVSGMALLVALVERAGGMELFTTLLARLATPGTVNGVIAFVTGLISTYSSTSGVVLPTFLPMAPALVREVGGGDPLAVALSINVGASLVDVSPLSTLGALCVAAVADPAAAKDLFRALMIWGLSMSIVGALLCLAFAGWFAAA
jgi:Na+/H+ antiporter NhaD/arsenite permease-like protein